MEVQWLTLYVNIGDSSTISQPWKSSTCGSMFCESSAYVELTSPKHPTSSSSPICNNGDAVIVQRHQKISPSISILEGIAL
jgi:hypothetical protein